jgi:hypothetical protein
MKNGINTGENRIPQKRIEKPLSHFRKYGNRTLQIRKRTDKSEKRNGSEREFLRPFSTLDTHTSVQRCRFILVIFFLCLKPSTLIVCYHSRSLIPTNLVHPTSQPNFRKKTRVLTNHIYIVYIQIL